MVAYINIKLTNVCDVIKASKKKNSLGSGIVLGLKLYKKGHASIVKPNTIFSGHCERSYLNRELIIHKYKYMYQHFSPGFI